MFHQQRLGRNRTNYEVPTNYGYVSLRWPWESRKYYHNKNIRAAKRVIAGFRNNNDRLPVNQTIPEHIVADIAKMAMVENIPTPPYDRHGRALGVYPKDEHVQRLLREHAKIRGYGPQHDPEAENVDIEGDPPYGTFQQELDAMIFP